MNSPGIRTARLIVCGLVGLFGLAVAEAQDSRPNRPIPQGEIVLYGHSLFTQWKTAKKDLAPLPVHNLAFGGSRTHQLTQQFDKRVLPYKPQLIVLNTGANFLGFRRNPPEAFAVEFEKLLDKIHRELPRTRILWMSITPCPKAWESMRADQMEGTRLARKIIEARDYADFIDMDSIAVDKNGELIGEIFKSDGIHYVRKGYEAYIRVLKPVIQDKWRRILRSR
jgi:lysophospholipase L1-like esterase